MTSATFVVVGGGIAGVTCAEHLSLLNPEELVVLITASNLVKAVTNYRQVSKTMEEFDVEERPWQSLQNKCTNVKVIISALVSLKSDQKCVTLKSGDCVQYKYLCLCCGAIPKLFNNESPFVLGLRDVESAKSFSEKLIGARRVIIVGNGGIATELAYEIEGVEVIWVVKDLSITSTFVDGGAAKFFLEKLSKDKQHDVKPLKRHRFGEDLGVAPSQGTADAGCMGSALGPDWHSGTTLKGTACFSHKVHIEYEAVVEDVVSKGKTGESDWNLSVRLSNGKVFEADWIVSATGVDPNTQPFLAGNTFELDADDGGVMIDDQMRTNVRDVYAAGDVATASWKRAPLWRQMRLWSQARQMGAQCAKSMSAKLQGEIAELDFCFELFAHVTRFFGYKVVLLGLYNGQGVPPEEKELLVRVTDDVEYIKVVLSHGRMIGAVLVGDTDMEETFENLILNQLDLTPFKEHLLDPGIDIDDFFD